MLMYVHVSTCPYTIHVYTLYIVYVCVYVCVYTLSISEKNGHRSSNFRHCTYSLHNVRVHVQYTVHCIEENCMDIDVHVELSFSPRSVEF